jgi:hypothetical protein
MMMVINNVVPVLDLVIRFTSWISSRDAKGWEGIFKFALAICAALGILLPSIGEWLDKRFLTLKKDNKSLALSFKAWGRISSALLFSGAAAGLYYVSDW